MQVYDIVLDGSRKETTRHGSFEFPLAVYTTQISRNILGYVAWHWHEELQFCVVTDGTVDFHVQNEVVSLSEGEGIFINVGQMHQARNHPGCESAYICLDFHPDLLAGFLGSAVDTKSVAPYITAESPSYCVLNRGSAWQQETLDRLIEIHERYTRQEEGCELQIQILLLQSWQSLVTEIFQKYGRVKTNVWDPRIKKMMDYIHLHYMESLSLGELAHSVNLSESACCRTFKRHVKCTVFQYLMDYRLTMSTHMLLTGSDSITDIAYQCGFGSTSYFIERFRKRSGVSPLVYKVENKRRL